MKYCIKENQTVLTCMLGDKCNRYYECITENVTRSKKKTNKKDTYIHKSPNKSDRKR